ncbi:MAG: DNA-protecting protein DprA [Elusimicrobia bacterium]|nr:DNA-protecting protein DprA [Elusimicrobiota bacterium]
MLRAIPDPPEALYWRGLLPRTALAVAFVGSRRPTGYGRRMARSLAGAAARAGLVVVSGLARGIDSEAHEAALAAGGTTWAVLGSGLDRVYPPENAGLAERIERSGGCLLSEFAPGTPPLAGHFPRRNRVIAGLCWAVVVVEGRLKSGSLITARLAANQGRAVLAVPGPADSSLSEAPHLLIQEGARAMTRLEDLIEELPPICGARWARQGSLAGPGGGLEEEHPSDGKPGQVEGGERGRILDIIGHSGATLDEIVSEAGLDLPRISHIIFQLELEGLVAALDGQRYARLGSY